MEPDYQTIVFLGDSITDGYFDPAGGWAARFIQKLNTDKPHSFYANNFAVSGDRITDVWHRLASQIVTIQPDILMIAGGVNDLTRIGTPEAPLSLAPLYRAEMWENVLGLAKNIVPEIYVFDILPVVENRMPGTGAYDQNIYYFNSDIRAYNEEIKAWCTKHKIPFIERFKKLEEQDVVALMFDQSHPNEDGHSLLADLAYDALTPHLMAQQ